MNLRLIFNCIMHTFINTKINLFIVVILWKVSVTINLRLIFNCTMHTFIITTINLFVVVNLWMVRLPKINSCNRKFYIACYFEVFAHSCNESSLATIYKNKMHTSAIFLMLKTDQEVEATSVIDGNPFQTSRDPNFYREAFFACTQALRRAEKCKIRILLACTTKMYIKKL
ncbi:hypothetical protein ZOSMA_103G00070 [Zostera marina]|uniref:Uncharacterized protein n=1 Tax=Zostera marina TaxID=29655 RepID=A0A0K9Q677_ZOSMR|nr:hypothetical protein ZOSMA_103G00070 [Zostera marina]